MMVQLSGPVNGVGENILTNFIGNRFKEERKRLKMSQPKVAEIAEVSKNTVIAWEKGSTSPTGVQLSALFGEGFDILYVLTGDRRPFVEKTGRSVDILDFGKRLDYLTNEFNALKHHHEVAETPSNFAKTNHLPLKELLTFNTTARQELQSAIASVQEVVVEEGMLLTPEQFSGVVVGVLSDEEVHDCIKESKLM